MIQFSFVSATVYLTLLYSSWTAIMIFHTTLVAGAVSVPPSAEWSSSPSRWRSTGIVLSRKYWKGEVAATFTYSEPKNLMNSPRAFRPLILVWNTTLSGMKVWNFGLVLVFVTSRKLYKKIFILQLLAIYSLAKSDDVIYLLSIRALCIFSVYFLENYTLMTAINK